MSKFLNRFSISFISLSEGMHNYDFEITDQFFENFELSEINSGQINVTLILEKQNSMFSLNFKIRGVVKVECDLCLDEFEMQVDTAYKLFIKLGTDYSEESYDVITIPRESNDINVAQYIYEFIHLSLPIKRVHPIGVNGETTCNPQMIERLNALKTNNQGNQTWDVLKNIKKN